ncbi:MAG: hypothetical protein II786_04350, partial [Muribaculaceae bacterium]|nr:hypothetical protein [Muribaculaceae bacterium]
AAPHDEGISNFVTRYKGIQTNGRENKQVQHPSDGARDGGDGVNLGAEGSREASTGSESREKSITEAKSTPEGDVRNGRGVDSIDSGALFRDGDFTERDRIVAGRGRGYDQDKGVTPKGTG